MLRPGFAEAAAVALLLAELATVAAPPPDLAAVRLAGGPNERQGQLQVQIYGYWYSAICQTGECGVTAWPAQGLAVQGLATAPHTCRLQAWLAAYALSKEEVYALLLPQPCFPCAQVTRMVLPYWCKWCAASWASAAANRCTWKNSRHKQARPLAMTRS